jgi:hypothetical protein
MFEELMVGIIGGMGFAWFSRSDGKQFFFIGMEEFLIGREEILTQFGYRLGMVSYLLYRITKAVSGNGSQLLSSHTSIVPLLSSLRL